MLDYKDKPTVRKPPASARQLGKRWAILPSTR